MSYKVWMNLSVQESKLKVLRIHPNSWVFKVDVVTESKDRKVLTLIALIGNPKTHEMNINQDI